MATWMTDVHEEHKRLGFTSGNCYWCDLEPRCSACGERIPQDEPKAEVVNKSTGARSLQHAECYLADTCCYDLA